MLCLLHRSTFFNLSSTFNHLRLTRSCRGLLTLAIETSCDDTSVAILDRSPSSSCRLIFHEKVTSDNRAFGGIHPGVAVASHQQNLSSLIHRSLQAIPASRTDAPAGQTIDIRQSEHGQWMKARKPDFISVTRGPGIVTALSTGLETAKGLALAWQIPLVGVNHMHAHAITPRLDYALNAKGDAHIIPEFPYLSLLVSGGHTLLVHSKSLCEHITLASTVDIAVGDALDKMARSIMTPEELGGDDVMYGRVLEQFALEHGSTVTVYAAPRSRAEEVRPRYTSWGWALPVPLAETKTMAFSFTGLGSAVKRICDAMGTGTPRLERTSLAREAMRITFEHLASRVIWALEDFERRGNDRLPTDLVVSGGVASNRYLRMVLQSMLEARGFHKVKLMCPPLELCTDNAAMIAWAGMEMFEQGWVTKLSCHALRRWSIDPQIDGGILGAQGWARNTKLASN